METVSRPKITAKTQPRTSHTVFIFSSRCRATVGLIHGFEQLRVTVAGVQQCHVCQQSGRRLHLDTKWSPVTQLRQRRDAMRNLSHLGIEQSLHSNSLALWTRSRTGW